jgi:hypothetical protein
LAEREGTMALTREGIINEWLIGGCEA